MANIPGEVYSRPCKNQIAPTAAGTASHLRSDGPAHRSAQWPSAAIKVTPVPGRRRAVRISSRKKGAPTPRAAMARSSQRML